MAQPQEKIVDACVRCGSICCKHVALEIDKPTTKQEYDNIRWYLVHKDIEVFVEDDGKWYLKFATPCTNLKSDGRCGIYESRPHLCRGYPPEDRECEFVGNDPYYKVRFTTAGEFESYMDGKKKNWRYTAKK